MMSLPPELATTEDGSLTLFAPTFGEHYHSTHGARQESEYIFLRLGLLHRLEESSMSDRPLRLFEVGLGTGLNALLTKGAVEQAKRPLCYYSIERYPLEEELANQLNYSGLPTEDLRAIHEAPWGEDISLSPYFTLHKIQGDLTTSPFPAGLDLIYFDAFSPESQPELWEEGIFRRLFEASSPGAVLTTYCAKGEVRRRLQRAGFLVERLAGPPGKREVLRATRPLNHD